MALLVLSLLFLLVTLVIVYYLRRIRLFRETSRFPGPPTLPFIGNAHILMGNNEELLSKLLNLVNTYSSPFRLWIAHKVVYVVYDPEQLKTILLSPKTIEKGENYKLFEPWLGTSLLTAPASKWKAHRKLIVPAFNMRILESFVSIFSKQAEIMVKKMEAELNKGEFEIHPYTSLCVLDMICETAMGISLNAQSEENFPYIKCVHRLSEIINYRAFKVWLHPSFIFNNTQLGRKHLECIEYAHSFTNSVIKQRKQALEFESANAQQPQTDGKRKAFLDRLIQLTLEGTKFTDQDLREEVDTFMIAANDTTTDTFSFAMLMLASHPEIQDKVYEEQCEINGSEEPCNKLIKHEDLPRMQYLERVIKETLRLFQTGALIFRRVTGDLNIGDYTLMKGSSVALGILKTHRCEKYWTDPLIFNPDRFLPEECAKRHPYAFIPFSGGPRNCPGFQYSMMALKTMIATIVRKYEIKRDNVLRVQDIRLQLLVTLRPVEPVTVKIEKRIFKKSIN